MYSLTKKILIFSFKYINTYSQYCCIVQTIDFLVVCKDCRYITIGFENIFVRILYTHDLLTMHIVWAICTYIRTKYYMHFLYILYVYVLVLNIYNIIYYYTHNICTRWQPYSTRPEIRRRPIFCPDVNPWNNFKTNINPFGTSVSGSAMIIL